MNESNFDSSNIHLSWLENILEQLRNIQNMERMMREGCQSLIDFVEIPLDQKHMIIPEAQYQNMKFIVMELDILVGNLAPILMKIKDDDKTRLDFYTNNLKKISEFIYNKSLFLKIERINNVNTIKLLPFFDRTVDLILKIKKGLIKDIGNLLYLEENQNKRIGR